VTGYRAKEMPTRAPNSPPAFFDDGLLHAQTTNVPIQRFAFRYEISAKLQRYCPGVSR
jgi:hypothetical protein